MTYRNAQALAQQLNGSEYRWLIGCHTAWQPLAVIGVVMLLALTTGCTDNTRTRTFGGVITVDLPNGKKLENVTWKEGDLWYLVRPMRPGETPETHHFIEKSAWGTWEGSVILHEYPLDPNALSSTGAGTPTAGIIQTPAAPTEGNGAPVVPAHDLPTFTIMR